MAKRKRRPDCKQLAVAVERFAEENDLELSEHNAGIHVRLDSPVGIVVFDCWPGTGRYYIVKTNYVRLRAGIKERQGELGYLPEADKVDDFLSRVFYPLDYL